MIKKYVERPDLPTCDVKTVLVGAKYAKLIRRLDALGISVIEVPANPDVAAPIAFHADISAFHFGNGIVYISSSNTSFAMFLRNMGYNVIVAEACGQKYPSDVKMNACLVGSTLFYHNKGTSYLLIQRAEALGYTLVPVNQGYVKCSVCVLNYTHIVTADAGIAKAAESNGISALRLSADNVRLDGYGQGFIGGACGKLSKSVLAFTGRLKNKADEVSLENYASDVGVKVIYFSNEQAYDVGSIMPLEQSV